MRLIGRASRKLALLRLKRPPQCREALHRLHLRVELFQANAFAASVACGSSALCASMPSRIRWIVSASRTICSGSQAMGVASHDANMASSMYAGTQTTPTPPQLRRRTKKALKRSAAEAFGTPTALTSAQKAAVRQRVAVEHKQELVCLACLHDEAAGRQVRLSEGPAERCHVVADVMQRTARGLVPWEVKSCDDVNALQHAHGQADFQRSFAGELMALRVAGGGEGRDGRLGHLLICFRSQWSPSGL